MILGVRAHDFGKSSMEELAEKISAKGFQCIQLALWKAIEGLPTDPGFFSPGLAYRIRETFYKRNIQIAVLGCYINPIHPDPEERKKNIMKFKEHIRYASQLGSYIVATETGHVKPEERETAFNILLGTVEELVYEAEKFGVFIGIEGGDMDTISSPEWMYRLLSHIKSNNLQVVFDPFNFIPKDDYQKQDDVIKQSFELFGDKIVAVHAKDFMIENGKAVPIHTIGKGLMNYELLLKLIKTRKPYVNVSMEGTRPETMEESKRFITELYEKI